MILLIIERDLREDVAGLGIDSERYILGREVRHLGIDALVGVLGMHPTDELARLALAHFELVRQSLEFGILVVDVRHLDVHRCCA